MDLSSAFNRVNRTKLWAALGDMGMDEGILNFFMDLHQNLAAVVRYGKDGECTPHFSLRRGVRHGCILAPFLLLLYINQLEAILVKSSKDIAYIGKHPLAALLYADDAVLIARTALGLQKLVDAFVDFMAGLDLSTNTAKSQVMVLGPRSSKSKSYVVKGVAMTNVNQFSYLGVRFDSRCTWGPLLKSHCANISRAVGALFSFASRLGRSPTDTMIKIYQANCVSVAMYGCEIWGYCNVGPFQIIENRS